jgi:hypothetical protein
LISASGCYQRWKWYRRGQKRRRMFDEVVSRSFIVGSWGRAKPNPQWKQLWVRAPWAMIGWLPQNTMRLIEMQSRFSLAMNYKKNDEYLTWLAICLCEIFLHRLDWLLSPDSFFPGLNASRPILHIQFLISFSRILLTKPWLTRAQSRGSHRSQNSRSTFKLHRADGWQPAACSSSTAG